MSARQTWIVTQLPLRPTDRVLELGCGHGVAATAICDRLQGGTYHGIDRSALDVAELVVGEAVEPGGHLGFELDRPPRH